jgi:hypothetical protein
VPRDDAGLDGTAPRGVARNLPVAGNDLARDIPNELILLSAKYVKVHRSCKIVSRIDNKIGVKFAPEPTTKREPVQTTFV